MGENFHHSRSNIQSVTAQNGMTFDQWETDIVVAISRVLQARLSAKRTGLPMNLEKGLGQ